MQIQLSDTYQIESDSRQWALKKLGSYQDSKTGETVEKSEGVGYYGTLPVAIEAYFQHRCRISEAKGLQEATAAIREIYQEIKALVATLDFKVELSVDGVEA